MRTTLYVTSDLHLGGAPSSDHNAGFQMCPPATQELLVNLLDRRRALPPWTGETRVCGVAWLPFVVEVMNSLNPQCAFADLLKREDASALPSAASC